VAASNAAPQRCGTLAGIAERIDSRKFMAADLVGWSEEYVLGLDGIDEQHKSLFEIINRIWQGIIDRADNAQLAALVDELEHYTRIHFVAEEAFMQSTNYPDFEAHKRIHQTFVDRVEQEKAAIAAGRIVSLELVNFLQEWLAEHIKVSDREYANFTNANKNGSLLGRFFKRFW